MFEKASRLKLRFDTNRGGLCVEDLWDLPLTSTIAGKVNLDAIAVGLFKRLQNDGAPLSFVETETKTDEETKLKFDIVRHIIEVKKTDNKAALDAKTKADQKQKILGILADKQDESLRGKSLDELQTMLATL